MSFKRQCPKCQQIFEGGERFCTDDGEPLPAPAGQNVSVMTSPSVDPWVGKMLGERFLIEAPLGQGGMGLVYRARHKSLGRPYAIKLLRRELLWDEASLQRFYREARIISALSHPSIVTLYDCGHAPGGEPYLAMEYVDGMNLLEWKNSLATDTLPVAQAVDIALRVMVAMEYAHKRGVVHRDLKPENIILIPGEEAIDWVKVLDFGLARMVGQAAITEIGTAAGTPPFIAPETCTIPPQIGPPADLYALGILLHDMIAGTAPFVGSLVSVLHRHLKEVPPRLSARRPDAQVPVLLDDLVAALLRKQPQERPSGAQAIEVLEDVRDRLAQAPSRDAAAERTLILNQPPAPEPWNNAQTVILTPEYVDPRKTQVLSPLQKEVSVLADEIIRQSRELAALAQRHVESYWPHSPPQTVAQALSELHSSEQALGSAEQELVRLRLQLEQTHRQSAARKAKLREQIMALSRELQDLAAQPGPRRQAAQAALSQVEAAYDRIDRGGELQLSWTAQRLQVEQQRGELGRRRRQLAVEVLAASRREPRPNGPRSAAWTRERQELQRILLLVDSATAALTKLSQHQAAGP
jgi:serine/threonine-protein kinase